MIHSVTANKTSFKSVRFEKGLNLIVAIRTKGETDKNTRNGVGKSTLFRIIDFCLGSDVNKPGTLMAKYLEGQDWEFSVELDIRGRRVKVTRAVDNNKFVQVVGDISGWPILPDELPLRGFYTFTIDQWKKNLGWALFALPNADGRKKADKSDDVLAMPSAREMLHFFIRKGYKADIAIVRPASPWTIDSRAIQSKCGWSPLAGTTMQWRVEQTICNGQLVYDRGTINESIRGQQLSFDR